MYNKYSYFTSAQIKGENSQIIRLVIKKHLRLVACLSNKYMIGQCNKDLNNNTNLSRLPNYTLHHYIRLGIM